MPADRYSYQQIEQVLSDLKHDSRWQPSSKFVSKSHDWLLQTLYAESSPSSRVPGQSGVITRAIVRFSFITLVWILAAIVTTVGVAQATIPTEPLYPLKIYSEHESLELAPQDLKQKLAVRYLNRRLREMEITTYGQWKDGEAQQESIRRFFSQYENLPTHTPEIDNNYKQELTELYPELNTATQGIIDMKKAQSDKTLLDKSQDQSKSQQSSHQKLQGVEKNQKSKDKVKKKPNVFKSRSDVTFGLSRRSNGHSKK